MDALAIETVLKTAVEAWGAPGAALVVVQGDEVLYMGTAGVKEQGKPDPVTPDTLFAIASTTKALLRDPCTSITEKIFLKITRKALNYPWKVTREYAIPRIGW